MTRHYPEQIEIQGNTFNVERILKDDFYSVNVLYRSQNSDDRYVLKLSDFRFIFGKLLRPLAMLMSWREYSIYTKVAHIPGVPELGPRYGSRGYFHRFVDGLTLFEVKNKNLSVPDNFFEQLREIIDSVHQQSIFYVDLNKLGNIILGSDGKAYLIDYQICIPFPDKGLAKSLSKDIFETLKREDLYHLYKHKSRFCPISMTDEERKLSQKSMFNLIYDRIAGRPWRAFKRTFYPHGSNEVIWYKWKKMQEAGTANQMEMP